MSGYYTYTRYQRIEAQAKLLGFRLGHTKNPWGGQEISDKVTVYPADDSLPVYSRDADLFTGTFHDVEVWLTGWAKAQQYDCLLRMTDDKRRKKFEDAERERQRVAREREEKRKTFAILSNKTEEEVDKLVK